MWNRTVEFQSRERLNEEEPADAVDADGSDTERESLP
jgi:hypothetical protein